MNTQNHNNATLIVIAVLKSDRKLRESVCERILREYEDMLGLMAIVSPEKQIEFLNQYKAEITDHVSDELADMDYSFEENKPVLAALLADVLFSVNWSQVTEYLIPKAVEHLEEIKAA
jgi:hypothetical protein